MVNISNQQLKILILLTLKNTNCPVEISLLKDILGLGDINYFNINECIADAFKQNLIFEKEDDGLKYIELTENGKLVAQSSEKEVPLSVRKKISAITMTEMLKLRKNMAINTFIESVNFMPNAYYVNISLKDDNLELMNLKIFAPTKIQAELISKNFRDNSYSIYHSIIKNITELT